MSVPQQIGRYSVGDRIGSGAFGSVWRAHDAELDSEVAVKILAENWVGHSDVVGRFVEEARVLRRADSDRIVRVYDIGTLDDGRPYFVMSYADRGTLADRIEQTALPVPEALRLIAQVARAVAVLHDHGILHRDIKPSNVLFCSTPSGERTMLADLGLAKAVANASGLTVAAGTPGYMAPEQSTGVGVDKRVDVYALGALAYQLLTGQRLPAGADSTRAAPPGQLRTGLPPGTDDVVMRALAPDRERRFPDAGAFAAAVEGLVTQPNLLPAGQRQGSYGVPVPPDATQAGNIASGWPPPGPQYGSYDGAANHPASRARRRKRLVGIVAGACVLALLAGIGIYYGLTRPVPLQTSREQITVEIPRNWAPDSGEPGEAVVDIGEVSPGIGNGILLSSQPKPNSSLTKHVGITVIAAHGFADLNADSLFDYYGNGWAPHECAEEAVTSKVSTEGLGHGSLRTWTIGNCVHDKVYARAYLATKKYGVEVFMVADKNQRAFKDVLDSIRVKERLLPE